MGSPNLVPTPSPEDKQGIVRAIQKLASLRLNADSTPTFAELTIVGTITADALSVSSVSTGSLTITDLTASRIMFGDGGKIVDSVENLAAWIAGTTNQVTVTDDTDGTITLSSPQDIHTGATPTFADVTITGLSGSIISSDSVETSIEELDAALYATNEPTGFPNRTDSTLSLSSRTFTVTAVGATFDYWQKGTKYTVTTSDSVEFTDVTGTHAIYFDAGTMSSIANPSHSQFDDLIENKALIALVYWNTTVGYDSAYVVADERHGVNMSGATHHWLHDNMGASYSHGLTISGYTLDTATDLALSYDLTDGVFYDEDIEHDIDNGLAANQYEQVLQGDAELPVLMKLADGSWVEQAASTLPYVVDGSNDLQYMDTDNSWTQTTLSNSKYMLMWIVSTNDWQYPIKAIQGSQEYNSKTDATEGSATEIIDWGDLPSAEFIVLYQMVLQQSSGESVNGKIIEITDFRFSAITGSSATSQDHGSLSGLADDDHTQYHNDARAATWLAANQSLVDHGSIAGLSDDDHVSYLLIDGTRAMTGDLDMDGNDVSNTGNVVPDVDATYDLGGNTTGAGTPIAEITNDYWLSGAWWAQTSTQWVGQSFTTVNAFTATQVSIGMKRTTGIGNITGKLYATAAGIPTGSVLSSSTIDGTTITTDGAGELVAFVLDSSVSLDATTQYVFIVEAGTGYSSAYSTGNPYLGGDLVYTTNGGTSYARLTTADCPFIVYSQDSAEVRLGYRNLYLSSNLSDGTDELTVAQAKAAYDHSLLVAGNPHVVTPTELSLVIGTDVQAYDVGLLSLAGLTYVSDSFIKVTATDTYALRTVAETASDIQPHIDHDSLTNFVGDEHIDWKSTAENFSTTGSVGIGVHVIDESAIADTLTFEQPGAHSRVAIYSDTTKVASFDMYQGVSISETVNFERFRIANSTTSIDISHTIAGTGFSYKPITIGTGGYTQLTLAVDGSVTITGNVSATNSLTTNQLLATGSVPNIGTYSVPWAQAFFTNTYLEENSNANADYSGLGQLWVKNDAPNTLWFTNDSGDDTQLGVSFTTAGDASSYDYISTDLTLDNAFHDIDLSSVAPSDATAVIMSVRMRTASAGDYFAIKPGSNVNNYNISYATTQVANQYFYSPLTIAMNSSMIVKYAATNTTWTNLDISILGWLK